VEDAAIATDTLLESLWAGSLVRVVRVVVDIIWSVQLIDGGPVCPVPDFIELPADEHLIFFGAHRTASLVPGGAYFSALVESPLVLNIGMAKIRQ
jgi:hypothetical protein